MSNYVLITGASGGIGLHFAKIFAEKGYNLILVARSKDKLDSLKQELETNYSITINIYPIDLTSDGAVKEIYDDLKRKSLVVDILVNNAAMKGKNVKYHGIVTYGFNIISRCLPRGVTRNLARNMNKTQ